MHYDDSSPCDYFSSEAHGTLIAVGWLEPGHAYAGGEVDKGFVEKLCELLIDPWQPVIAMGRHACGFCRLTGGPAIFQHGVMSIQMGVSNLFVPGDGLLYVAPSLILHYMDAHGYQPPAEFQHAVMACPKMRSMDYLKAVLKNGPKGIANGQRPLN